jgi:uncharacterized membrane protein YdcZ (DUF606 family)
MDILNFISWIKGKRIVTSVNPSQTLIPVGLKDNRRDDGYLASAITVTDLANQLGEPSVTFVQGSLEPLVEATMSSISGTITLANGLVLKKYRIQGAATLTGSNNYALLIGVVSGSEEVIRVIEDTTILAQDTNVYDTVASAMNRSVLVSDPMGNLITTTSTFIADDNTISTIEDHWFTLVMTAAIPFKASVVIDFTIAIPETATVEFVN